MSAGRMLGAIILASVASAPAMAADDDTALTATAAGFYEAYATFHPSDGIPSAEARERYRPFVSQGLDRLMAEAAKAETRFTGKYKDSPPVLEGDLFTSNFEGATSYAIGKCEPQGASARCVVDLAYVSPDAKNKPVSWTDRLYLVRTSAGWRVDDIAYGANWAFGNKGRLSETLKEAIADAGS